MKTRAALLLIFALALAPAMPVAAADAASLPIEQQLFNDFALRMQDHLQRSAALLERIRQSVDLKERDKLMGEYQQLSKTTMKIQHLMQRLAGEQHPMKMSMMKGKKKMGCMGKECEMMKQGKSQPIPQAFESSDDPQTGAMESDGEPGEEGGAAAEDHEKHH
jgi:hypothetical protein